MADDKLKLFRFYWNNPDQKHTFKVSLVIATNEAEARKLFQENEKNQEEEVRDAMKDGFPADRVEEIVKIIRNKVGLKVLEYPLEKGVIS